MQEKRHDRVVEMRLCFFSGKVSDYKMMFLATRKCRSTTDEALKILHKAKELNPNGIYVFEPNGEIMTTDSFNRRLKKYCKEAGVPYHSSHKIRFYNASTAFDGNNLTTLSYLMGHSETATTLHYLRNVNKRKNDRLAFQNLGISS